MPEPETDGIGVPVFLIDHDGHKLPDERRTPLQFTYEPLPNRVAFVEKEKTPEEVPIRLRWMQKVEGKLPPDVMATGIAYAHARDVFFRTREAHDHSWVARTRAWEAHNVALMAHFDEIEALFWAQCPGCPWDGKTLFPEGKA